MIGAQLQEAQVPAVGAAIAVAASNLGVVFGVLLEEEPQAVVFFGLLA